MPPQSYNPYNPNNLQPSSPAPRPVITEDTKNIIYTVALFILSPFFAVLMIVFIFQSYVVDGSSMESTLQDGNRVFILKLPKTFSGLRGKQYVPSRGEVVVFKKPSDPGIQLIKRVIGLPGDRVVVKNNKITVYNTDQPSGFNPDSDNLYANDLDITVGDVDVNVGENELFVVGDNRSPGGSLDSRNGLGLVPTQNVVGRLWIRYFPLNEIRLFSILQQIYP